MTLPARMKFGSFMAPYHFPDEKPTLSLERDLELIQWLEHLDYDEVWVGEHHSAGWEIIGSPEIFIATAAAMTKRIRLGTGVVSLPYHHPFMVADRLVLLDHLTRGRLMFGVGPGALTTDAMMIGVEPRLQRPRMDEALGIILRLFTETEPITYESEWFKLNNARLQLRPYQQPHMPIAVAAVQTPAGMVTAGKYGAAVLTLSMPRNATSETALLDMWRIAEDAAAEHGKTMHRSEWRLVIQVHLAETREQAIAEAKVKAGRQMRDYHEATTINHPLIDRPQDEILQSFVDQGLWCVGSPDDLIAMINRLDQRTGGFGGILIQHNEWATREQVLRSYELLARYVIPQFQGSLTSMDASQADARRTAAETRAANDRALAEARDAYFKSKSS